MQQNSCWRYKICAMLFIGTVKCVPNSFTHMQTFSTLSLATATALTERSKRTWWRRIEKGLIKRVETESVTQARVLFSDVIPLISIPVTSEDLEIILRADAGDPEAQNDVGQMFSSAGKVKSALYWLEQAARQNHPDAMQCLGRCYAAGDGVPQNRNLSLMWIAKAAAFGHLIAKCQMDSFGPNIK